MSGFLSWFLSVIDPRQLSDMFQVLPELVSSFNLYIWLLVVYPLFRFQIPVIAIWIIDILKPDFWAPPVEKREFRRWPLVSVVIPGRNEADTIEHTIRSTLNCGYPNLEIIFVDDFSTDDTIVKARRFERTGRVKTFAASAHHGKPSSLNIGITMSRGRYIFVLDADSEVQYGAIQEMVEHFNDPTVGAVAANIRVRNAPVNFLTRLQECEYALNLTMSRLWRARMNLLGIVPGAAGMFRASILRSQGGYDTGLGEDTDMTLRLRKQKWRLNFALNAVVWSNVPTRWRALFRQRQRWERNMVKIRLRKQSDLVMPWRYGWTNTLFAIDMLMVRLIFPLTSFGGIIYINLTTPFSVALVLTHIYWITAFFTAIKLSISWDLCFTPRGTSLWMAPIVPIYRAVLRFAIFIAFALELLRIGQRHGYVPDQIWQETPHW